MTDLKTVQALVDALEFYRSGEDYQPTPASKAIILALALIAQMQREAVQPVLQMPGKDGPWKCGDEFLPYHRGASHIRPDYRDGWNACWYEALERCAASHPAQAAARAPEPAKQYAKRKNMAVTGDWMMGWDACRNAWRYEASPHPEAQALDSQLQQPDGHSTRASGVCATTTPLPDGYALVPVKPTLRMMAAAGPAVRACFGFDGKHGTVADLWTAMLAAAPSREGAAGAQQQDDHAGSPASSPVAVTQRSKPNGIVWYSAEEAAALPEGTQLYTHPAPSAESSKAALSDDDIRRCAEAAGFNLTPTANLLYTVRGNHAQLVNFARAILARAGIGESRREPCYCDKQGIGEPGVSCGDCPTRDYKEQA